MRPPRLPSRNRRDREYLGQLQIDGAATFLRLPRLANALAQVRPSTELHIDFEHLDYDYIDHACLDLLINWEQEPEATGGTRVIDWDTRSSSRKTETGHVHVRKW